LCDAHRQVWRWTDLYASRIFTKFRSHHGSQQRLSFPQREEGLFRGIRQNCNNESVYHMKTTSDKVNMTEGDGIKATRIQADTFDHFVTPDSTLS
jgi:hypothetical protein